MMPFVALGKGMPWVKGKFPSVSDRKTAGGDNII